MTTTTSRTDVTSSRRAPASPAERSASCRTPGVRGEFIRPSSAFDGRGARGADRRVTDGDVTVGGGPVEPYRRSHRPGTSCTAPRSRPNYGARRCLAALGLVAAIAIAVPAVGAVLSGLGGAPAVAAEASASVDDAVAATHVAQPGDTLWSIADRYRGDVAHDRYVDALIRLNGGTAIQAGQAVSLP